jgi:hypothetical protein
MPVVSTVNYITKRIYLHADTVGVNLDTMDIYKEVRELRAADTQTPTPHRSFKPMIIQGGNIQKTPTTKTAKYVQLLYGCRIIPFDIDQLLKVTRDTFTDDGFEGRDCFDRAGLTNQVDIDYAVDKVEVVEVNTGGVVNNGTESWSLSEKKQIRDSLGIDGDKQIAKGGQLQEKSESPFNSTINTNTININDVN